MEIYNRLDTPASKEFEKLLNSQLSKTKIEEFSHKHELDSPTLISLFKWSETEFKENTKNTPINRISYFQWLRNITIGLGNSEKTPETLNILKKKKEHINDSILIEHIDWAIKKLSASA